MEGAYSKVWAACSSSTSLPAPEFAFFTKKLTSTVREEIASCHERAYSTLNVEQARVLLFFERKEEIIKFSKEVRNVHSSRFLIGMLMLSSVQSTTGRSKALLL